MKSRLIILLMCIFVILSSFEAYCQEVKYTISGTINSSQGEPLVEVTVKVGNGSSGTVTDIDGKYSLKVAKGRHKLTVSCIGYKEKIQILFVESNCTINFSLEEDVVMMNNVVVVGESKNTKVKSGVFSANAIDVSSKLSSIQTIANEVEKGIGVRIRRSGGIGSDYNLTLNGMGGNSIRYYVDGIPMAAKGESFSLENIPASIVDRVEVYKGVVPAYLGGDALGGAINIVTNESKKNYYDISYRVGSFNTHQVDFNAQIIEPKTGLTFKPSVGYNFSKNNYTMKGVRVLNPEKNEFETGDFKRFHDDYRSVFAQFETGFTNKLWTDFLYVTASFTNVDKDIQTGATQDVVYGAAHRKNRSWNLGIRYRKKNFLAEGLTLSANASHTWQKSTTVDTAMVIYFWNGHHRPADYAELNSYPVIRYYNRPNTSARVNLDYRLAQHSSLNFNYLLNATVDRMNQETSDETKGDGGSTDYLTRHFLNLSYDLDLWSGKWHNTFFVKEFINTVRIEEKTVGSGASHTSGYDSERSRTSKWFTCYGFGTRYKLHSILSAKLSYEYSVRLPGAMELLGDGDNINANYALEPEKSNNYNVNLYGNWDCNSRLNVFYEAGVFYRDVHDFIMAVQDRETYTFKNLSRISIKGLETEVGLQYADKLLLKGNLSYEKAVDMMETKISDGKPNAAYKQQIPNRPSLYANINASYTFRNLLGADNKLRFEYDYQYVKWFYLTWSTFGHKDSKSIIPTQNCHNLSATFFWLDNRYSVSLECNNLFDQLLYDNYKLQKPGRALFCKFRMFFN